MSIDESPLVSIIVPSYNVETYVKKCLDSIKSQTYTNWECIIVDRQSTKDNTTAVIKDYIKSDDRFRYIKQINKGVSDGRNVGFKAAKGKYVQFTDPDDWLAPELLALSVERAEKTQADIVQFGWSNYYVQTGQYVDAHFMQFAKKFPTTFSVASLGDGIFKYGEIYINSMSKLWRRNFLIKAELHYPTELKRAEDLAEVSRLVMNASSITYLDKILYFYKVDEFLGDSLSNFVSDDGHNLDFYKAIIMVRNTMEDCHLLPKHADGFCRIAISNAAHALHMSKFNLAANRDIYNCIRTAILPLISAELKYINLEWYKIFTDYEYEQYLQENIKETYFDNQAKQNHINFLDAEIRRLNGELVVAQQELHSHQSVKRSAKLTLGNVKRKIIKKRRAD